MRVRKNEASTFINHQSAHQLWNQFAIINSHLKLIDNSTSKTNCISDFNFSFYSTPFRGRVYKWKICLSVHLFVCHHFLFNRYLSIGRSNKKNKKTRCIFFQILLLGGPSPPSQLMPNPFNWSPDMFFVEFSSLFFIGFPFVYR